MAEQQDPKLVTIKLIGNLMQQGFQVSVEIGLEGQRPFAEKVGALPADAELLVSWQAWRQSYHRLKQPTRIRPLEISYHGSIHSKINDCIQQAQTFHQRFQHWLIAPSFAPLNQLLREELNRTDTIRVVIRTDDLPLQQMPWHLWDFIDRYPLAEVGLTPLSIQHSRPKKEIPNRETTDYSLLTPTHQVRVLAILGHSAGIDIEQDQQLIEALPNAAVTYLVEPERQQLNEELWNQSWDILFFAGHSLSQPNTKENNKASETLPEQTLPEQTLPEQTLKGRLYINPKDSLTITELSYGFRQAIANGLQLAIFNSCDGLGLAHELEVLGLPHMILMREPVPDSVAQTFLRHFLTAYASGESLYLAEKQARERLQGLEKTFPCASWLPAVVHSSPTTPPSWQQLQNHHQQGLSLQEKSPEKSPEKSQLLEQPEQSLPLNPREEAKRNRDITTTIPFNQRPANRRNQAIKSSLIAALIVLAIRNLGGLQPLELRTFDHLVSHQRPLSTQPLSIKPISTKQRILIVEATETDLNTYGYPLPDDILAKAITALTPYNPRIIGLDIFRPNPTDPALQQAFSNHPKLITACSPGNPENPNRPGFAAPPDMPEDRLGFTTVINDPDGVIRRQLMFAHDPNTQCATRFSLSTLMALHYLESDNIYPENLDNQRTKLGRTTFTPLEKNTGPYHNVDSWGSQVFIGYQPQETFANRITLSELLSDQTALDQITDQATLEDLSQQAVLIGVSAPISNPTDYFLTPIGATQWPKKEIPGVVLHAQMLNHLLVAALEGKGIIKTLPKWGETIWILGWALLGASIMLWPSRKQSTRQKRWLFIGLAVVGIYSIHLCLFWAGQLLPLVPALLSFVLTIVTATVLKANTKQTAHTSETQSLTTPPTSDGPRS